MSDLFKWSKICFKSWVNSLQENPILIAVSTLSPVNTQTLIPEVLKAAIVSSTSSYNLSSIAVAATIIKFYSISDYSLSISASLSSTKFKALSYSSLHYSQN